MIYIVGDSTVSFFNETYYYHRYGWGTQISTYLNSDIEVKNLALSGRSSLSFLKEENYEIFKNNIKKGDYLFIGFGHNDEKDDDPERYTDPNGLIYDKGSFKYVLYNYYIKLALDKEATPIICTPICRLNENNIYENKNIHITPNGDYRKCIIDLATQLGIDYVDLTTFSLNLYKSIGYYNSCMYHAITKGKYENGKLVPDINTVDQTHINIFGAKTYAYYILKTLKEKNNSISKYITSLIEPTIEKDLVVDNDYVYVPYVAPDFKSYNPPVWYKTSSFEYIGTAFGDTSRGCFESQNGFNAYEENNKFIVGQKLINNSVDFPLGKIALTSEGIALIAKKVSIDSNFIFNVKAKVLYTSSRPSSGFGLSLRDDLYICQSVPDKSICSNYVASALLNEAKGMTINYSRKNRILNKSEHFINERYKTDDIVEFSIKRIGQVVEVKTISDNNTYIDKFTDFDFTQVDRFNFYICMFATHSTLVEFYDYEYIDKGLSQGA